MKRILILLFLSFTALKAISQIIPKLPSKPKGNSPSAKKNSPSSPNTGSKKEVIRSAPVIYIDGFAAVKIGEQTWMQRNLDVDRFRNGDPIPEVQDRNEWIRYGQEGKPAWCYFNNDPENGKKYGRLYNWHAVNDPRGLAPVGWHVPSDQEWSRLTDYLGGEGVAGSKLKTLSYWRTFSQAEVTNSSGWSALPGGDRNYDGTFGNRENNGLWWSSSKALSANVWYRSLGFNNNGVNKHYNNTSSGLSVRCVRD